MKRFSLCVLLCFSITANAATFSTLDALNRSQFRDLSKNLTAATHYKGIAPAEPLGVLGFDVGLSISATELNSELFDLADAADFDLSSLPLPRLSLQKGLPGGIDIGASITAAPSTDIKVLGAEIRYAILKGNIALPTISVRASYSTVQGVDELEIDSTAAELSISKGFINLMPYAGVGVVRSNSDPVASSELEKESYTQKKAYLGLNINLGFNLAFEADRTGPYTTYSAKAGFRF
ncbi:MAG: hypothetical protein V3U65_19850 [Granulosicoccaceae bacterium]